MSIVIVSPSLIQVSKYYTGTRLIHVVIGPLTRIALLPNSTIYIPDSLIEGQSFLDVRAYDRMLIEVEANAAVTVEVENSPTGKADDSKPLSGYIIDASAFDTVRRNTIAVDGGNACTAYIRLKVTTGATPPTMLKVWVEAKEVA
jgi:hypothetical protein